MLSVSLIYFLESFPHSWAKSRPHEKKVLSWLIKCVNKFEDRYILQNIQIFFFHKLRRVSACPTSFIIICQAVLFFGQINLNQNLLNIFEAWKGSTLSEPHSFSSLKTEKKKQLKGTEWGRDAGCDPITSAINRKSHVYNKLCFWYFSLFFHLFLPDWSWRPKLDGEATAGNTNSQLELWSVCCCCCSALIRSEHFTKNECISPKHFSQLLWFVRLSNLSTGREQYAHLTAAPKSSCFYVWVKYGPTTQYREISQ